MKWAQVNEFHWRRECGRYYANRVRIFVTDPNGEWVWGAWFKTNPDAIAEQLNDAPVASLESAIGICGAHLRSQNTTSSPAAA